MHFVTILGSTGSIGESALRVVRAKPDLFRVFGLACNRNLELLSKQVEEFHPSVAAVGDSSVCMSDSFKQMKKKFGDVKFLEGSDGISDIASQSSDIVVSAIVGAAGLAPSLAALEGCRRLALANKETLVMAGDIFMKRVAEKGVELIPVDSEHSAIFSLLHDICRTDVDRILITASGGSLRDFTADQLDSVTPEVALKHPTWSMGNKITIDSATLMNKGLEVIEAHHLFDFDYDRIDVIIHPESVIHSMVETVDGALYAHMGVADMAIPIINALTYPQKMENPFGRLDLAAVGSLTFRAYDRVRFPGLELCYAAGKAGGTMPAVLNRANEEAVYAFLEGKVGYTDIVRIVEETMSGFAVKNEPSIEDIFEADIEAKNIVSGIIKEKSL